jgi:hypothetical protein
MAAAEVLVNVLLNDFHTGSDYVNAMSRHFSLLLLFINGLTGGIPGERRTSGRFLDGALGISENDPELYSWPCTHLKNSETGVRIALIPKTPVSPLKSIT